MNIESLLQEMNAERGKQMSVAGENAWLDAIALFRKHTEGLVLVPADPTDEMLSELCNGWRAMGGNYMSENYKAMLSTIGDDQ